MSRQIMQLIVDFNSGLQTLYGAAVDTIVLDSVVYDALVTQFLADSRRFCTTDKYICQTSEFHPLDQEMCISTSHGFIRIKRHRPYQNQKIGEGE